MQIDLAEPDVLLARWGAIAAALTTIGYHDVWWIDGGTAHHDDHGGNWGRLVRIDGDRAVLYGYDHEYSDTSDASPPIDLLAGAPAWLPWPDLIRYVEDRQLGFVYWYDGGWSRVPYPDGLTDGLTAAVPAVLSAERAHRKMREVVSQWGEHDPADDAEAAAIDDAADRLLAKASAGTVDTAALTGLLGRLGKRPLDYPAGLAMAARAGLVPGSTAASEAAGTTVPARRIRLLSDDQHQELVWAAMRQATEATRPVPAPTTELAALVDWARGRARPDGRCSVLFQVLDNARSQQKGEAPPTEPADDNGFTTFREVGKLVQQLWVAEADPVYGHWLYVRLEISGDGYSIERRYDSWPDWFGYNGSGGPWLDHLRTEIDRRAPEFRPAWSVLLDPDIAYTGPPAPYALSSD